jgi:hypothetical protein
MGITPQELKKIMDAKRPETDTGGFVTRHFASVSTRDITGEQWMNEDGSKGDRFVWRLRQAWNGRKLK